MVLSNHEPQAAAAAVLSPGTTAVTQLPNSSGRAPPRVTGTDTSQHPLPLQDQGSEREAGCFKGKGREAPGIFTQSSSICSIKIQAYDTVPSNRKNSGVQ